MEKDDIQVHVAALNTFMQDIIEHDADLIIVGMLLKKRNGLQISREVRSNPATKDIPIILVADDDRAMYHNLQKMLSINQFITRDKLLAQLERMQGGGHGAMGQAK